MKNNLFTFGQHRISNIGISALGWRQVLESSTELNSTQR